MTALFISVVSHHNDSMIIENQVLANLANRFTVVLKSNTPATIELKQHCIDNKIKLIDSNYGLGFGCNNNLVHKYCSTELEIKKNDLFLVLNPDVLIDILSVEKLVVQANKDDSPISTINLYSDENKTIPEQSIKKFPEIMAPIKGLLQEKRSDAYDKTLITEPTAIDWAAGSFLLFKMETYQVLNGFDEKYFMYFEDVDLCRRAGKAGIRITYYPNLEAVHFGSYSNRNVFSRSFWWYLRSYLRYHFK
ncbi:glycosyltransferase family 2 protein [Photobacterium frigidiphilum]|uniref:galactosyltransferase-related protein n=1 Tax=Photobacterium frigidiphilum TaxID=264736 RepID=UPI003D0B485C